MPPHGLELDSSTADRATPAAPQTKPQSVRRSPRVVGPDHRRTRPRPPRCARTGQRKTRSPMLQPDSASTKSTLHAIPESRFSTGQH
jgi:hypothetical protein